MTRTAAVITSRHAPSTQTTLVTSNLEAEPLRHLKLGQQSGYRSAGPANPEPNLSITARPRSFSVQVDEAQISVCRMA